MQRVQVEKLKAQCREYNEWTELSSKKERLKRFLVAYDYTESMRYSDEAQVGTAGVRGRHSEVRRQGLPSGAF